MTSPITPEKIKQIFQEEVDPINGFSADGIGKWPDFAMIAGTGNRERVQNRFNALAEEQAKQKPVSERFPLNATQLK